MGQPSVFDLVSHSAELPCAGTCPTEARWVNDGHVYVIHVSEESMQKRNVCSDNVPRISYVAGDSKSYLKKQSLFTIIMTSS